MKRERIIRKVRTVSAVALFILAKGAPINVNESRIIYLSSCKVAIL